MTLQTNDVGMLFSSMQSVYGHSWAHGSDAIPIWQAALKPFDRRTVESAVGTAVRRYPDYPPTLGQFTALCEGPKARANTYLAGPQMSPQMTAGNRVLFRVLLAIGGVDQVQCRNLVQLKNALVEDRGGEAPDRAWVDAIEQELTAMAGHYSADARAKEIAIARDRHRVSCGIPA